MIIFHILVRQAHHSARRCRAVDAYLLLWFTIRVPADWRVQAVAMHARIARSRPHPRRMTLVVCRPPSCVRGRKSALLHTLVCMVPERGARTGPNVPGPWSERKKPRPIDADVQRICKVRQCRFVATATIHASCSPGTIPLRCVPAGPKREILKSRPGSQDRKGES